MSQDEEDINWFVCLTCHCAFPKKKILLRHKLKVHKIPIENRTKLILDYKDIQPSIRLKRCKNSDKCTAAADSIECLPDPLPLRQDKLITKPSLPTPRITRSRSSRSGVEVVEVDAKQKGSSPIELIPNEHEADKIQKKKYKAAAKKFDSELVEFPVPLENLNTSMDPPITRSFLKSACRYSELNQIQNDLDKIRDKKHKNAKTPVESTPESLYLQEKPETAKDNTTDSSKLNSKISKVPDLKHKDLKKTQETKPTNKNVKILDKKLESVSPCLQEYAETSIDCKLPTATASSSKMGSSEIDRFTWFTELDQKGNYKLKKKQKIVNVKTVESKLVSKSPTPQENPETSKNAKIVDVSAELNQNKNDNQNTKEMRRRRKKFRLKLKSVSQPAQKSSEVAVEHIRIGDVSSSKLDTSKVSRCSKNQNDADETLKMRKSNIKDIKKVDSKSGPQENLEASKDSKLSKRDSRSDTKLCSGVRLKRLKLGNAIAADESKPRKIAKVKVKGSNQLNPLLVGIDWSKIKLENGDGNDDNDTPLIIKEETTENDNKSLLTVTPLHLLTETCVKSEQSDQLDKRKMEILEEMFYDPKLALAQKSTEGINSDSDNETEEQPKLPKSTEKAKIRKTKEQKMKMKRRSQQPLKISLGLGNRKISLPYLLHVYNKVISKQQKQVQTGHHRRFALRKLKERKIKSQAQPQNLSNKSENLVPVNVGELLPSHSHSESKNLGYDNVTDLPSELESNGMDNGDGTDLLPLSELESNETCKDQVELYTAKIEVEQIEHMQNEQDSNDLSESFAVPVPVPTIEEETSATNSVVESVESNDDSENSDEIVVIKEVGFNSTSSAKLNKPISRLFLCAICSKTFNHSNAFEKHKSVHQDVKINRFWRCQICQASFDSSEKCFKHLTQCKIAKSSQSAPDTNTMIIEETNCVDADREENGLHVEREDIIEGDTTGAELDGNDAINLELSTSEESAGSPCRIYLDSATGDFVTEGQTNNVSIVQTIQPSTPSPVACSSGENHSALATISMSDSASMTEFVIPAVSAEVVIENTSALEARNFLTLDQSKVLNYHSITVDDPASYVTLTQTIIPIETIESVIGGGSELVLVQNGYQVQDVNEIQGPSNVVYESKDSEHYAVVYVAAEDGQDNSDSAKVPYKLPIPANSVPLGVSVSSNQLILELQTEPNGIEYHTFNR